MSLGSEHLWQLASAWITSHRVLIRCIASPYLAHMGCSARDLESEALLAAYRTLCSLLQNDKNLALMGRYFRVVFRTRCIQMTMGVAVIADCDMAHSNIVREEKVDSEELDQAVIDAAFSALTARQRQVAKWILSQPTPVSVNLIGLQFGITARGVRKLINNAIFRIENGHRRVCQTVSAFT